MTCYLRFHEVLVGVGTPETAIDWDVVASGWQRATTVAHRYQLMSTMALEPIDVYDLPSADLGRFSGLVVSDRVDQEFLHRERDTIRGFLEDGKVLVFIGGLPLVAAQGTDFRPLRNPYGRRDVPGHNPASHLLGRIQRGPWSRLRLRPPPDAEGGGGAGVPARR